VPLGRPAPGLSRRAAPPLGGPAVATLALAALAVAVLAIGVLAPPVAAQSAACVESGLGVYGGWHRLRYRDRVRLCADIERREWEAAHRQNDPEYQRWRQQECLVNAAACDIPGVHSSPPPVPPAPPPPPPSYRAR
jgi:hypothetical protein